MSEEARDEEALDRMFEEVFAEKRYTSGKELRKILLRTAATTRRNILKYAENAHGKLIRNPNDERVIEAIVNGTVKELKFGLNNLVYLNSKPNSSSIETTGEALGKALGCVLGTFELLLPLIPTSEITKISSDIEDTCRDIRAQMNKLDLKIKPEFLARRLRNTYPVISTQMRKRKSTCLRLKHSHDHHKKNQERADQDS